MYSRELIDYDYSVLDGRSLSTVMFLDEEIPPRPMITFKTKKGKTSIYDSKIGGIPYMSDDFGWSNYPLAKIENRYVRLPFVAQLNLSQLPRIEGIPEKGILQFYLLNEDYFDKAEEEKRYCVVYHRNILTDKAKVYNELRYDVEVSDFVGEERLLVPHKQLLCPVPSDYHDLDLKLVPYWNCGSESGYSDYFTDFCDDLDEKGIRRNFRTCVGGYGSSYRSRDSVSDVQLFQVADSKKERIVHFSINNDRLAAWDFSRAEFSMSRKDR